MASHLPPVPPANRSKAGPGGPDHSRAVDRAHPDMSVKPDQKGQSANTKINLTHQGMQQDR